MQLFDTPKYLKCEEIRCLPLWGVDADDDSNDFEGTTESRFEEFDEGVDDEEEVEAW